MNLAIPIALLPKIIKSLQGRQILKLRKGIREKE